MVNTPVRFEFVSVSNWGDFPLTFFPKDMVGNKRRSLQTYEDRQGDAKELRWLTNILTQ